MEEIVRQLQQKHRHLAYKQGTTFCWSPETKEVFYPTKTSKTSSSAWSLLHETSHALLNHTNYSTDFELLRLEVAAWEQAKHLADELNITIDEDYIQDCLDTYRDWLYARSICPYCNNKCLQQADLQYYRCFNCHSVWRVTPSRFCRAYRAVHSIPKTSQVLHNHSL